MARHWVVTIHKIFGWEAMLGQGHKKHKDAQKRTSSLSATIMSPCIQAGIQTVTDQEHSPLTNPGHPDE
jgi:hypothetical protein